MERRFNLNAKEGDFGYDKGEVLFDNISDPASFPMRGSSLVTMKTRWARKRRPHLPWKSWPSTMRKHLSRHVGMLQAHVDYVAGASVHRISRVHEEFIGLFLMTSGRLNHSCEPNLEFDLSWDESRATVVCLGLKISFLSSLRAGERGYFEQADGNFCGS